MISQKINRVATKLFTVFFGKSLKEIIGLAQKEKNKFAVMIKEIAKKSFES